MGIEDTMGARGSHSAPAQGPAGTGAYKKTVKKGYAGYGDIITPKAGSPGGVPGYAGVPFGETNTLTRKQRKMAPNFFGGPVADPYYQPKTEAETMAIRDKGGIAKTAKNMGSLGVRFREEEAATKEAGGVTDTQKRANTLNTIRQNDRTKRWKDAAVVRQKFWDRYMEARKDWTGAKGDPKKRGLGNISNKAYAGPGRAPLGGPTAPGGPGGARGPGGSYGLF